jgi:ribosomal protein S18 acetylase RimI-like enzyme
MKRLYVRPASRARGIGTALIARVIADAAAIGYRDMVLDTLASMAGAQALYERFGFRDIAPYYDNPLPGARYMRLGLARPSTGARVIP